MSNRLIDIVDITKSYGDSVKIGRASCRERV